MHRRSAATARLSWCTALCALLAQSAGAIEREVAPQALDARVGEADPPHWIAYEPALRGQGLLVWLSGTGGRPHPGPQAFFQAVREQGYRLVSLSYRTRPAVAQVCVAPALRQDPDCAAHFRRQRIWGDAPTPWIPDQEQDAIVPRLTRLLRHLADREPDAGWADYLEGQQPRWSRIVLAGQSQGGGMAAYLAQERELGGVLLFSGGWDRGEGGAPARWYRRASRTPSQRWHSVHHAEEPQAEALARIDALLGVPERQRHTLSGPVARNPHTEGIGNPEYRPLWLELLRALKPGLALHERAPLSSAREPERRFEP